MLAKRLYIILTVVFYMYFLVLFIFIMLFLYIYNFSFIHCTLIIFFSSILVVLFDFFLLLFLLTIILTNSDTLCMYNINSIYAHIFNVVILSVVFLLAFYPFISRPGGIHSFVRVLAKILYVYAFVELEVFLLMA